MRLWPSLAVAGVMLALLPACGRKAPPKPPELVAPRAIGDLHAANRSDGILLSWPRPRKHADGAPLDSLGGFVVERAPALAPTSFEQLTTIELTDRERFRQTHQFQYLDRHAEADGSYLYRVIAFTIDGYHSEPSNTVLLQREPPPPATATPAMPHGRGNSPGAAGQ